MSETLRPLASATASRQTRARALRERIEAAPGRTLSAPRDDVLALFPPPAELSDGELARRPAVYAQAMLVQHGVRATPPVTDDAADTVRLVPTRSYAIQGAALVAAVTIVAGVVGYWVYGVIFVLTGLTAVALLATRFEAVDRRLTPVVPRGRLLGAALAAVLALGAGLVAIVPLRLSRSYHPAVIQSDSATHESRGR